MWKAWGRPLSSCFVMMSLLFLVIYFMLQTLADELHLVAVGIVHVHGAAGQNGMFAAPVSRERLMLRIELLLLQLKGDVMKLIARRRGAQQAGRLGEPAPSSAGCPRCLRLP